MKAVSVEAKESTRTPMRTGIALFLVSEAFLFGALFWTYYYLRANTTGWPPEHPEITLAAINTFFLLSSSLTIWWATISIRKGNERGLALGLATTILLGATFLGITIFEWTHEPFIPSTNAYASIFFTLTGFHALHVLGGVLMLSALLTRTLKHKFSADRFVAVSVGSYYWHYVDFIWIIVFTTLFIIR